MQSEALLLRDLTRTRPLHLVPRLILDPRMAAMLVVVFIGFNNITVKKPRY